MPCNALDEAARSMEAQTRADKAMAVRCIEGLSQYAAELRQKGGPGTQGRIPALRNLVCCLAGYWGLLDEPGGMSQVEYQETFDRGVAEAGAADRPWFPTPKQRSGTVYGLYRYAMDLIPNLGVAAEKDILGIRDLIREIEQFWDYGSPVLDQLCAGIESSIQAQAARESELRIGGIQ